MAQPSLQPEGRPLPNRESREVFVGRQEEMVLLEAALAEALAGAGRLVMMSGAPGIGKTRTAQELASRAERPGVKVLWGRCSEEEDHARLQKSLSGYGSQLLEFVQQLTSASAGPFRSGRSQTPRCDYRLERSIGRVSSSNDRVRFFRYRE